MSGSDRWEGLDWLRGLAAFAVMIFHGVYYLNLIGLLPDAVSMPLSLLGYYAVSAFYGISGCALYFVYHDRKVGGSFLREFTVKRVFRIVPLFWLATTLFLAHDRFAEVVSDPVRVFLNYSLLFSWFDPSAYFATGAWSIGNEIAFYSLFPLLLVAFRSRVGIALVVASSLACCVYWAFRVLPSRSPGEGVWESYVHPLNQVVLFTGGMVVAWLRLGRKESQRLRRLFVVVGYLSFGLFLLISYSVDSDSSIMGVMRCVLVLLVVLWVLGASSLSAGRGVVSNLLRWLGDISYSVYLLHPFVFFGVLLVVSPVGDEGAGATGAFVGLAVAVGVTLLISHFTFHYFEKPIARWGRRFA